MIRAIRPAAVAQADASMISGWNITPNADYILSLTPGPASCAVLLLHKGAVVASGAGLVGAEQPVILSPHGVEIGMLDEELGWHLKISTTGTEAPINIPLGPMVDLPDELQPMYADTALALARATAAIDQGTHITEDVQVLCPRGSRLRLGESAQVPIDSDLVSGQVESAAWAATPDGDTLTLTVRRYTAIGPAAQVQIPSGPISVADDSANTVADKSISGNVLKNDGAGLFVVAVEGMESLVGVPVAGSNGGTFTIQANGDYVFDPGESFYHLSPGEEATTSISYYASDGAAEGMAKLSVVVFGRGMLWSPELIDTAVWLDAAAASSIVVTDGAISEWQNRSGNGRHATQVADGGLPTLLPAAQAGLNAVKFDGAQRLGITNAIGVSSVFFVAKWNLYVKLSGVAGVNPGDTGVRLDYTGFYYQHPGNFGAFTNPSGSIFRLNGKDGRGVVGDAASGHLVSARRANSTLSINRIGGYYSGRNFNGHICEIVMLDEFASDELTQKLEGYLAHKWGVTDKLPAEHPYKYAPPRA